MSDYTFANMPSVKIARSKFNRTQTHNTSFNLGELVCLQVDEIVPGSTHKLEIGSLIRMSTPIAPIMDDIQFDIFSFFVPARLTWDNWKYFCGESKTAGYDTVSTYTVPYATCCGSAINTLADDMGIPPASGYPDYMQVNVLPFRGFYLIYNRFFRNQNVEAPLPVYTGDNGQTFVNGFDDITGMDFYQAADGSARLKAYKLPDYFTSSLPYAQKGDPVKIPGTDGLIPVITGDEHAGSGVAAKYRLVDGTALDSNNILTAAGSGTFGGTGPSITGTNGYLQNSNLWANAAAQVGNTINDLRFAFQLQKALEKDAMYGSRYWEILRAHYGITVSDKTLQDPQLIGHFKFDINIQQVLQTTGFSSPDSTSLGTPGANSVTPNKSYLHTFSAEEHGYVYVIGVARQKRHTYSQGLPRMWSRKTRFDFYYPVFANLGAQKVLNKEIYYPDPTEQADQDNPLNPAGTFGFQEAWAEYRYLPSHNSGLLNPDRPNALDYWTLADKYDTLPTLSKSFLLEDRSNLTRALVTGANGPDFIGSFYFKDTCVNPMPLYSIPGFADHH